MNETNHNDHGDAEEYEQKLGDLLATIAEGISVRHELNEHNGQRCQTQRCGIVAFVAHRIGVGPDDADTVREAIEYYQSRHDHDAELRAALEALPDLDELLGDDPDRP